MDTQELLNQVVQDEQSVVLNSFNAEDAWDLGCLMVQMAREQGLMSMAKNYFIMHLKAPT